MSSLCGNLHPRSRMAESGGFPSSKYPDTAWPTFGRLSSLQLPAKCSRYRIPDTMFTISKSEIGIFGLFPVRLLYCFGRRFDLCGLRHQSRDAQGVLLPPLCSLSFFRTQPTPGASSSPAGLDHRFPLRAARRMIEYKEIMQVISDLL